MFSALEMREHYMSRDQKQQVAEYYETDAPVWDPNHLGGAWVSKKVLVERTAESSDQPKESPISIARGKYAAIQPSYIPTPIASSLQPSRSDPRFLARLSEKQNAHKTKEMPGGEPPQISRMQLHFLNRQLEKRIAEQTATQPSSDGSHPTRKM